MTPEIEKTIVTIQGKQHEVDTILYAGGLWMVPGWTEIVGRWRRPARLIRLDPSMFRVAAPGLYVVDEELPVELFSPEHAVWRSVIGYEVANAPHLAYPSATFRH